MRLAKRYLKKAIDEEVMAFVCNHYEELRKELFISSDRVRCGQSDDDLFHNAIMIVSEELTITAGGDKILAEVKRKYHSLRIGIEREEMARKEVLTYNDINNYADDL